MHITLFANVMFLSCLPLSMLSATEQSTKMCHLCLQGAVGIIHRLNDSKATILAKIDDECNAFLGTDMTLYRICVTTLSKIYLKMIEKLEKEFDPNSFCTKMHACSKNL